METNGYIALDIGGTQIKGTVLDAEGKLCVPVSRYASCAQGGQEEIIANFERILQSQARAARMLHIRVRAVGIAMPGPFDFDRGIFLMSGLDKYEAVYGVCLREALLRRQRQSAAPDDLLWADIPFRYCHDVASFALGESMAGRATGVDKVMCLCIGTGSGSAFLHGGALVTDEAQGVPPNGWIYPYPFHGKTIDDIISARGLNALAVSRGFAPDTDGLALFNAAGRGDERAMQVWATFGEWIAEAMEPFALRFGPQLLLLGGQITKSYQYFKPSLEPMLTRRHMQAACTADTTLSTLRGLTRVMTDILKPLA